MFLEQLDRAFPFFSSLSQEDRQRLSFISYIQEFKKKEVITDGKCGCCSNIIIVLSGRIKALNMNDSGKTVTLYYLFDGDVCVLSAAETLYEKTIAVSLIADTDVKILKIPAEGYKEMQKKYPAMQDFIRRLFTDRFSDILFALREKAFSSPKTMVALLLTEKSSQEASPCLKITQTEIANDLAIARSLVSQILSAFEKDGLIRTGRGKIEILDFKGLLAV